MPYRRLVFLFIVVLFTAAALPAQTSTSAISGTITDATGGVVPSAKVSVTNDATGAVNRQETTPSGLFSFASLPVGLYTVAVEQPGFKTARRTGITLTVGTPVTVDIAMEVGQTSETVSVASTYEQLQTSSATLGNVVERKVIVELPLNGRNPLNLIVLEPGVVQRTQGGAGTGIHVNGSRDFAFNTTIDGIEANESSVPNPTNNVFRLNPDNVQEYKVTTSNATPEEGRNSGASVSIATRSGTNELHGTVFHFLRNTKLNSNDFFSSANGTPKPDIKMNQFGLEMGGPIRRNKTFFFGSYQQANVNFAQPIDQVFGGPPIMYTPEALGGKYRYFRVNPNSPFTVNGTRISQNVPALVDPKTGALAAGVRTCGSNTDLNCIGTYDIYANDPRRIGADPKVMSLLRQYPAPNSWTAGDGLNTATYLWNPPVRLRGPNIMGRVDHTINDNNTVFFRYLFGDADTIGGDPNNSRPQVFPNFPPLGEVYRRSHNMAASWRTVISPRIVNDLTLGYSRFYFLFTQGEANPAFPDIPPYDFANISDAVLNRPRTNRAVNTPQILDNLSIVKGSHVVRMGFNFRFYQHNDQRGQPGGVNVTPVMSFSRVTRPPALDNTLVPGINVNDSNRLLQGINELLGIPAQLQQVFLGDLKSDAFLPYRTGNSVTMWAQGQRMKQYNFYLQDEWKIRRNMTINYGARWEINMAPTEAGGRVYVPDKSFLGGELVSFVNKDRWYQNNNLGAIGPRLGLTWAPGNGRTVFRTGYGMAFDPIASFQVTAVAGRPPGITTTCQSIPGGSTTPGCAVVPDRRVNEGFPEELTPPTRKPSEFLTPPRQLTGTAPNVTVFDQNLKLPTVHQWNFNIQRELAGGTLVQVAYVGRRGTRLYRGYDLNQISAAPILDDFKAMQANIRAGCAAAGTGCPAGVSGTAIRLVNAGVVNALFVNSATTRNELLQNAAGVFAQRIEQQTLTANLRPNQQFNNITFVDSGGDSYFHSFQAVLRKRFSSGLTVNATYAFAKSIDNQSVDPIASSSGGGLSTTNSRTPADISNWRNERAVSDFDRRHVFNSAWLYELPFGKNKAFLGSAGGALNHFVGGWSLNGIFSAYTSEPWTVNSGTRTNNASHISRAALVGNTLPSTELKEQAGSVGPVLFTREQTAQFFAIPGPGENGMGRNMFRGPGYWNFDLAAQKNFQLTERFRLQFRAETFNTLNHASFQNPSSASSGSNQITSARFGETCCEAVAPNTTSNIIQTGESGRVVQFGLKLSF
ncbi:MAG: carboxypeptidase regulatory-like domain-containing protein [Acidobacteria bacterium]|nr:carboxypeptidase regulatory-like domain-containing protein [Acidobacteriota bacterium]